MLKIALCDDNIQELNILENYILNYKQKSKREIVYDKFSNSAELLTRISSGCVYDLVFLNTVMPVISGIEAAKEIFSSNKVTKFVFVTNSEQYAVESYCVDALDYILKPINQKKFNRAIKRFEDRHQETCEEGLVITDSKNIIYISTHSLIYVEVLDHYLMFHISNGDHIRIRRTMSEIEGKLVKNKKFIKTHRSFIVNMDYISKLESSCITMKSGDKVSMSKDKYKSIMEAYLKYADKKGTIMI